MDSSQRNRKKRERSDSLSSRTKRGPGELWSPVKKGTPQQGVKTKSLEAEGSEAQ